MRISGCRLKEKTQDRLAEFFVGGVTARSAADLARSEMARLTRIDLDEWNAGCAERAFDGAMIGGPVGSNTTRF
jgi:hypothetical protein